MPVAASRLRRRVRVVGVVQGVGFRPFIYRHAASLGLAGWVANDRTGVIVEAEGDCAAVDQLCAAIAGEPPARARVDRVWWTTLEPTGERGFRVLASMPSGARGVSIGPDVATCADCLRELADPNDRRHGYPFTNCSACGPRYTIVRSSPYDRASTTMAAFRLCDRCAVEYSTPTDRRFHAEPIACPACGPQLDLVDPGGRPAAPDEPALEAAVRMLLDGGIVAVKGLGGFHLVCDAANSTAVQRLRNAKQRPHKPFAVMAESVERAGDLIQLDATVVEQLTSPLRPVVVAPRQPDAAVAGSIAPGSDEVGVMLPYTPLHHLLVQSIRRPVVMTSGNAGGEPIVHSDSAAVARLGPIVDALLRHDRAIHMPCDDSVVRVAAGRRQTIRRSRGSVPRALTLPTATPRPVLAVGADLKNTVALAFDDQVVVSHHLGDLEHLDAFGGFVHAIEHLCELAGAVPEVVAHDLHPDFRSTTHAAGLGIPTIPVQHHHAHVASCLAEHRVTGQALGVAFDGFGYGADGTAWGGEFLVADLESAERVGHLRPVALPGAASAVREPWRMAVAWVAETLGREAAERVGATFDSRWAGVLAVAERPDCLRTSAVGRLFDAVAALLGVCRVATYEGQAAVELEALAGRAVPADVAAFRPPLGPAIERRCTGGALQLDPAVLMATIVEGVARDVAPATLAAWFHEVLGEATADAAAALASERAIELVVLTGGVFQNCRLTEVVRAGLQAHGLRVLLHESVPPNDGGISVGQAAVAAARLAAGVDGIDAPEAVRPPPVQWRDGGDR